MSASPPFKLLISSLIIFTVIGGLFLVKPDDPQPALVSLPSPTPEPSPLSITASISAEAAVIMDASSGAILAAKNPDLRLMPASTTKMMTAYVAFTQFQPDEVISITRAKDAIGKSTKFSLGEQYLMSDILQATLINSGNDAALSLADHYPGGYTAFVDQMNREVTKWGLKNTHFANVSGVEQTDHYSSARDLSLIARQFMQQPTLKQIVASASATITSIDGKYVHTFTNTNKLLGKIPGLIGIKTGWTDNSGECLVTYLDRDHDLILVVLNSLDRFKDTTTLIDWFSDLSLPECNQ